MPDALPFVHAPAAHELEGRSFAGVQVEHIERAARLGLDDVHRERAKFGRYVHELLRALVAGLYPGVGKILWHGDHVELLVSHADARHNRLRIGALSSARR